MSAPPGFLGCGVAGLSAAVTVAEAGARVAVAERFPYDERGGNTRDTTATLRMESEDAVSGDFVQRFLDNCGYHIDPEFAASTVLDYASWPAIVRALPFTDTKLISFFAQDAPSCHRLAQGARHQVRRHRFLWPHPARKPTHRHRRRRAAFDRSDDRTCRKIGVQVFYEITAQSFLQTDQGAVCVLRAITKAGTRQFDGRAVILACGGFKGNHEMVVRYIGMKSHCLRLVAHGRDYDKGECIVGVSRLESDAILGTLHDHAGRDDFK